MKFKVTHIEQTPFGNREPLIDKMCFAPILEDGQEIAPAQHLEAHRCHSQGAPSVGDVFCLLPVEAINAMRLENLSLKGRVAQLQGAVTPATITENTISVGGKKGRKFPKLRKRK